MQRHARQMRVEEVGIAGQARVAAADVEVRLTGFAADIAVRYLAGAGFGCLRLHESSLAETARKIDPGVRTVVDAATTDDEQTPDLGLRDPVAHELAVGALTALRALRAVLGVGR